MAAILSVRSLTSGYGRKEVLHDVTLEVVRGEIVGVIGRNGAGKSTLLKTIFGLVPRWEGAVAVDGCVLTTMNPRTLRSMGVGYLPQRGSVFPSLTVRDNLELWGSLETRTPRMNVGLPSVLELFPALGARLLDRAGTLSGGLQRVLAVAGVLGARLRLLLLDEPSLGLSPDLVRPVLAKFGEASREHGLSVVIVEQKVREVLRIAQRVCVLRNGTTSYWGPAAGLQDEETLRKAFI